MKSGTSEWLFSLCGPTSRVSLLYNNYTGKSQVILVIRVVCPLFGLIPIFFKTVLFILLDSFSCCLCVSGLLLTLRAFLQFFKCVENNKEVHCHIIELFTWTTSYFLVSNIFPNLVCFLVLDYIILNDGLYKNISTIGWRGSNVASRIILLLTVG